MMENLKPCPFCGGEAEINQIGNEHTKSRGFEVKCTAWGCATKKRAMVIRHTLDDARVFAITAWNTRPSPARDEGAGTMGRGEEFLEFKEALSDLRSLRHEYECLNGGGPGWAARNEAAWAMVNELFAEEDEAAWVRQQEDAHG